MKMESRLVIMEYTVTFIIVIPVSSRKKCLFRVSIRKMGQEVETENISTHKGTL